MAGASQAFLVRLYPHPQLVLGVFPFTGKLNSGWQDFFFLKLGSSSCSLSPLASAEQCSAAEAELPSSCPASPEKKAIFQRRLFWACREDQGGGLNVLDHLCPRSAEVVSLKGCKQLIMLLKVRIWWQDFCWHCLCLAFCPSPNFYSELKPHYWSFDQTWSLLKIVKIWEDLSLFEVSKYSFFAVSAVQEVMGVAVSKLLNFFCLTMKEIRCYCLAHSRGNPPKGSFLRATLISFLSSIKRTNTVNFF